MLISHNIKMGKILQNIFGNVLKIRIEGLLNYSIQHQAVRSLQDCIGLMTQSVVVLINSQGGSLPIARNLAAHLKAAQKKHNIPVICFAEEYCLNSANLILAAGSKCYGSQFSIMGDFGYIYEGYDFSKWETGKFGSSYISNNQVQIHSDPLGCFVLHNPQFVEKWVRRSENSLVEEILQARAAHMDREKMLSCLRGRIVPRLAVEMGLLDGIGESEQLMRRKYKFVRVVDGMRKSEYFLFNGIKRVLEMSR